MSNQEVLVSDLGSQDAERLTVRRPNGDYVIVKPDGLEHCVSVQPYLEGVTVEQLRAACERYSARKTTVPGSYAHRHYVEKGHSFGFGCCLGTEAA